MPTINEHGYNLINWGDRSRLKYWKRLSDSVIKEFGDFKHEDFNEVNQILEYSINKLIEIFQQIINEQENICFYKYILKNNDNYFKVLLESDSALKLNTMEYKNFTSNRKVLKLILEQACEVNLKRKNILVYSPLKEYQEKLEDLLYIGNWIYYFADKIALTKFNQDFWEISFDEDKYMIIESKYEVYSYLTKLAEQESTTQFQQAINNATPISIQELKQKIEDDFISYDGFFYIIKEIQNHHLKNSKEYEGFKDSSLVDIENGIIEQNLVNANFDKEKVQNFCSGLTLSKDNKQSILDTVIRPHNINRFHYKPLLKVTIDGKERILVSTQKILESILMLRMNALPFGDASEEWKKSDDFKAYLEKIKKDRGDLLEYEASELLKINGFIYDSSITNFKKSNNQNINIINKDCGEIDLLYVDAENKKLIVVDCKFLKMRTEGVGFNMDLKTFKEKIEPQIDKKVNYLSNNISHIEGHFQVKENNPQISLKSYQVEGIIIINTPTLYMYFNSKYKILTLSMFSNLLNKKSIYQEIQINDKTYSYPYLYTS